MADANASKPSRLALLAFLVFVIIALVLGWLLNDLRLQFRETAETVNAKLPSILEKTEKSAEALAELSEDVRQLRDLSPARPARATRRSPRMPIRSSIASRQPMRRSARSADFLAISPMRFPPKSG